MQSETETLQDFFTDWEHRNHQERIKLLNEWETSSPPPAVEIFRKRHRAHLEEYKTSAKEKLAPLLEALQNTKATAWCPLLARFAGTCLSQCFCASSWDGGLVSPDKLSSFTVWPFVADALLRYPEPLQLIHSDHSKAVQYVYTIKIVNLHLINLILGEKYGLEVVKARALEDAQAVANLTKIFLSKLPHRMSLDNERREEQKDGTWVYGLENIDEICGSLMDQWADWLIERGHSQELPSDIIAFLEQNSNALFATAALKEFRGLPTAILHDQIDASRQGNNPESGKAWDYKQGVSGKFIDLDVTRLSGLDEPDSIVWEARESEGNYQRGAFRKATESTKTSLVNLHRLSGLEELMRVREIISLFEPHLKLRELEVLKMRIEDPCASNTDMAEELNVSEGTIRNRRIKIEEVASKLKIDLP